MNKLIVILCVAGLISNVYFGLFSTEEQAWTEVFSENGNDEKPEPSYISSVIVPNRTLKEKVRYKNEMFMEMYWENKTSGNWTKYTLNIDGEIRIGTLPIEEKEDGFGDVHSTVCTRTVTSGKFELLVEENDGEPVVVPGDYNAERWEYMDLNEEVVIQIVTDGEVSTEAALAYTSVPLTFNGEMRSYPNPNKPRVETLDEKIYGNNKEIKIGDEGNITKTVDVEWNWTGYTYHWIANNSEKVSGYDAIRIDINTTFYGGWMPFNEKIWISSETPYPVKVWSYTNTSGDDENYTYYMRIETTRTMQYKGYSSGTSSIPWGTCTAQQHFKTKNPEGDYKSWYSNYMPVSGNNFNDSSFDFKPEDAVNYAIQHSSGLKSFMDKYDDVVVHSAVYTAEQDIVDSHAGTYWWNLTFGHNPSREEWEKDDHWKYSYNIKIECDIEKHLGSYDETLSIAEELGLRNGSSPKSRSEFNPYMLTLTSSEELLKQDEAVQENAVDRNGEIDFDEDTTYSFGVGDISMETLPGLDLIGTLTGITFPEFESGWTLQKGTIWENGETFSAGVDAETGQLLYVTHIKGTVLSIAF